MEGYVRFSWLVACWIGKFWAFLWLRHPCHALVYLHQGLISCDKTLSQILV
jgi:hypothetical protein